MNNCKKVGILTYSFSSNPGSVLQAYSLQQNIENLADCEATLINFQKTQAGKPIVGKTVFYKPIKKWSLKKIVEWTARLIVYPIRMKKYEKFFKTYYNGYPTERVFRKDFEKLQNDYDAFVVGSDQVWNRGSWSGDYTYFLDFVKDSNKKIAYAPSMGQKGIKDSEKDELAKLISDFSAISVREKYSVNTILELTGKKAEFVLDPSLLTDKEEYRKLSKHHKVKKKKYVFAYQREKSDKLLSFAKAFAKAKGLKLITVHNHWRCTNSNIPYKALGPTEWLSLIDNAEYVVTNSFHGICFSLIFNKEFYVEYLKNKSVKTNLRIEDVLQQFGLESRKAEDVKDFDNLEKIDYQSVVEAISKRKAMSLEFLKNSLERSFSFEHK